MASLTLSFYEKIADSKRIVLKILFNLQIKLIKILNIFFSYSILMNQIHTFVVT